jgi:3-phosphoshikimate 1-carboxyvinyltransferase
MQYLITPPKKIDSVVQLPSSKSISNRGLILNALSLNRNPIINLSDCEDTQVIIDAFNSDTNVFDVKAAGTAMRFLTAFLAGMEGEWTIKGSKRMHERPIYPHSWRGFAVPVAQLFIYQHHIRFYSFSIQTEQNKLIKQPYFL